MAADTDTVMNGDGGWRLYLLVGALATAAYLFMPGLAGNGLLYSALGLSAAMAIMGGVRLHRPQRVLPWVLFGAAQVSFVAGDLFYYLLDARFPSLADLFYLAVYPLQVAGLLLLIRSRTPGRDRASLIDASIITVGLGVLAWVFLIDPYIHMADLGLVERAVSTSYPLMDVLLLAVAARLAMGAGSRPPAFYLLSLAIVCLLVTDAVYGVIELTGGYETGSLLDVGWLAYYLLWGAAALHPGMRTLSDRSPQLPSELSGRRLLPLAAATLIAPAVQAIQSLRGESGGFAMAAAASAVLFLLVLARMTGLVENLRAAVSSERQAVFREGVLRRAAVALGAAADRRVIEQATVDAVVALTSDLPDVTVRVDIGPPATTPPGPPMPEARAAGGDVSVLVVPLATPASEYGEVVVTSHDVLPVPVRKAVETLGAQVTLALESAALAEDLLRRRSEARIGALVRHSSDMITVLNADLTVQYQSPSVARVLGYQAAELAGAKLTELLDPDDVAAATEVLAELRGRPGVGPGAEWCLRRADGSRLRVEAVGNNLLLDPSVNGIVVTIRDISERKALEEGLKRQVQELQELDRIKSDLVATVSHELRTPLTNIIGQVELLADADDGDTTSMHARSVEVINRNSLRLLSLIEDMLTLSRIESGSFHLEVGKTDLVDLIEGVRAAVLPSAAARSLTVAFDSDPLLGTIPADASQLDRALLNLLSNAVKFTPEGGTVGLTARRGEHEVVFTVCDTGVGIPDEEKDQVFTRFFRSSTATTMAIPGTGLGLSIVKRIVDEHGGTIRVDSTLGVGTTVTVSLPLVRDQQAALAAANR